jgi:hypothetical protein
LKNNGFQARGGRVAWVSALSYDAFSVENRVNFADEADADPAERALWGEWTRMDADMIWGGYKQYKGRVMAQKRNILRKPR